jgi:hypothetical protein
MATIGLRRVAVRLGWLRLVRPVLFMFAVYTIVLSLIV